MADDRSPESDDLAERLRDAATLRAVRDEGFGDFLRTRAWAAGLWLVFLAIVFTPILFALIGFISGSFVVATLLAPLLGLSAAGAIGHWRGYLTPLDEARRDAPLWARLVVPVPVFVLLFILLFVALGSLIEDFIAVLLVDLVLSAAGTGAIVWALGLWGDVPSRVERSPLWLRLAIPFVVFGVLFMLLFLVLGSVLTDFRVLVTVDVAASLLATGLLTWVSGLWRDVPGRIRESTPPQRLGVLAAVGLLGGLLAMGVTLVLLEQVDIALATLLPAGVLAAVAVAVLSGWDEDAREAILDWHFGVRLAAFAVLLVFSTLYFSLLIGPFLPNALVGYGAAFAISLLLLVPVTIWVRAWRDLWTTFVEMGEDRRILATSPILPLGAAAVFGLVVVTTSMFDLAYVLSIPAGVVLFLLAGLPFGVTQDIPRAIRRQDLPTRAGIFAAFFVLTTLYAYFAIALFVQIVEVALIGGLAFAGLLLGVLVWQLDLGEGMVEEFESYGGPAEAAVLGGVFVLVLGLSFVVLALSTGDFRIAFLVSVLVAAGANYVVAHTTGFVEGTRDALSKLSWWAELLVLSGVFLLAFLYGSVAVGTFLPNAGLAFALGALLALATVVALSRDLDLGDDIMHTADEKKRARSSILVLAFLGGFLVGLYVSAAALGLVGVSLFGFPFFIALITGAASVIGLATRRGWDDDVLSTLRTGTDKLKAGVILASWLGLGILTGFALQALPIEGPILGIGDPSGLPLTLTLAAGLVLWAWLPVVLFRLVRVERTPVDATLSMSEKRKTLASLGWGLVVFATLLVVLLTVLTNTVIAVGVALAAGYLTALVFSTRRGREAAES